MEEISNPRHDVPRKIELYRGWGNAPCVCPGKDQNSSHTNRKYVQRQAPYVCPGKSQSLCITEITVRVPRPHQTCKPRMLRARHPHNNLRARQASWTYPMSATASPECVPRQALEQYYCCRPPR